MSTALRSLVLVSPSRENRSTARLYGSPPGQRASTCTLTSPDVTRSAARMESTIFVWSVGCSTLSSGPAIRPPSASIPRYQLPVAPPPPNEPPPPPDQPPPPPPPEL